jgi:hypothetical protein
VNHAPPRQNPRTRHLTRAPPADARWLRDRRNRACRPFDLELELDARGVLRVPIPALAVDAKPANQNRKPRDQATR